MNKIVLKKFAIEARDDLREKIERKIKLFYLNEEFTKNTSGDIVTFSNANIKMTLTKEEDLNREKLIKKIVELGYERVLEEVSYTWFNRIIAIRYMELNDYLPLTSNNQSLGVRVLSSKENELNPDILKYSILTNPEMDINFSKEKYQTLTTENDKFNYILLLICKKLGKVIPQVFGGDTEYVDLLIPDNLLTKNSIIDKLLNEVDESDFKKVEIIGWLYQYYNQPDKDRVMAAKKIGNKYDIAYATQLFTPDWIVKYMVENSLGQKLSDMGIFGDDVKLQYKIFDKKFKSTINKLEELKFIDPCCGSGHIIVYAFDLLYKAYENIGYPKSDISSLILKNNIYALDIDDRAGQLSILSLVLKAREYDKNIFNNNIVNNIHVMSIRDSNDINDYLIEELSCKEEIPKLKRLVETFRNAKEIGSLLKIEREDYSTIVENINNNNTIFSFEMKEKIIPIIEAADILSNKYDVVVTNPPYMNYGIMPAPLKKYVNDNYPNSKTDLCSAFMEINMLKEDGYFGIINQHSWMFLSSFERLRENVLNNKTIYSMVHLGTRAFEEIGGEVVQTTTFVFSNHSQDEVESKYYRLVSIDNATEKEKEFLLHREKYEYIINNKELLKVPGYIFAYWASQNLISKFTLDPIEKYVLFRQGMATSDNNRFLRLWFEVSNEKICSQCNDLISAQNSHKKWFKYNKGGSFRKWYGNQEYVVNWENDGKEMKEYTSTLPQGMNVRLKSREYYFKECFSWSKICTSDVSFRYYPDGFAFDVAGCCVFEPKINLYYLLGLCNSNVTKKIMSFISPTLNFELDHLKKLPLIHDKNNEGYIVNLVKNNIQISKDDWDDFETSWDFEINPLIKTNKKLISQCIDEYKRIQTERINKLKENEELINNKFIEIYGLENDMTGEIDLEKIALSNQNESQMIKELISYSVGCMFGRYSLDERGLINAGAHFDKNKYKTYMPDDDNIIPISDDENVYYNDDIVGKFKNFIELAFGKETINENINYIAEILGKRGIESSEDTIRRYFICDFYADHIKMYQKKPIYWLFDSGKKNGFKCLIYLHRYNEQIVSKIRTKYLHNTISVYQRLLEEIEYKLNNEELSTTDKRELQNKKSDLNSKITECNDYDEMVGNVANKMIKLDLDDGVVNNYAKFVDDNGKSILAKIK